MKEKERNKKYAEGFTTLELALVMALLSIISLIAVSNVSNLRESAANKADLQSAAEIKNTIVTCLESDIIPVPASELTFFIGDNGSVTGMEAAPPAWINSAKDALKNVKKPQGYVFNITPASGEAVFDSSRKAKFYKVIISPLSEVSVVTSDSDAG